MVISFVNRVVPCRSCRGQIERLWVCEILALLLLALYYPPLYVRNAAAKELVNAAALTADHSNGCLAVVAPTVKRVSKPALSFQDGERIVWLGASFVERMQLNGHLETWLTTAFPDRDLLFRNLGWSGDTAVSYTPLTLPTICSV